MRSINKQMLVRPDRGGVTEAASDYTTASDCDSNMATLSDDEIITAALRILGRRMMKRGAVMSNPTAMRDFLRLRLGELEHEIFVCIFVDNKHSIIAYEELFRGDISGCTIHVREIIKRAMKHNASAVAFAHCHPSTQATPSQADEIITRRLKTALELIDVRVLDHFIVGGSTIESFAERGLL